MAERRHILWLYKKHGGKKKSLCEENRVKEVRERERWRERKSMSSMGMIDNS